MPAAKAKRTPRTAPTKRSTKAGAAAQAIRKTDKKTAKKTSAAQGAGRRAGRGVVGKLDIDVVRPLINPRIAALRREDFVALSFELANLRVVTGPPPRLERVKATEPAFLILHLPPQNIAERAFFETASGAQKIDVPAKDPDANSGAETPTAPPLTSRLAQASRVVFRIPTDVAQIPLTLAALLARCRQDALHVAPTALPPPPELGLRRPLVLKATDFVVPLKFRTKTPVRGRAGATVQGAAAQKLVTGYRARLLERRGLAELEGITAVRPDEVLQVKPHLAAPKANETAIEMPLRVIVSPHRNTGFVHATAPVTSATTGRTELWHTRLGERAANGAITEDEHLRGAIRAIWARSGPVERADGMEKFYPLQRTLPDNTKTWAHPGHAKNPHEPFRMSLDAFDRHNIVHLSANWFVGDYTPRAIDVNRLMLSSLGGWLDSRGAWTPPVGFSVEEWRNRSALGRDHYVRVVYAGFLLPFGNRASLVKITERKFHNAEPGNTAYMRQRMFLVVGEPTRTFRGTGFTVDDLNDPLLTNLQLDHQMPLARITITTPVTPNLDMPENSDLLDKGQSLFWPTVSGAKFKFACVAEDLAGQRCDFRLPMVFVEKPMIDGPFTSAPMGKTVTEVMKAYEAAAESDRKATVSGAKIAFALANTPGDTSFDTSDLVFGVQLPRAANYNALPPNQARFFPVMRKAMIALPVAKHFVGKADVSEFRYPKRFLQAPLTQPGTPMPASNSGEIFLEVFAGKEIKLDFGAGGGDKAGGMAKPNMAISALSRRLGPVGGGGAVDKIGTGQFDPKDFFATLAGSIPAKLFGVIDLWDVIKALGLDDDIAAIPKLLSEELNAVEGFINDILALKAQLDAVIAAGGAAAAAATTVATDVQQVFDNISGGNIAALANAGGAGSIGKLATDIATLVGQIPGASGLSDAIRQEVARKLDQVKQVLDKAADLIDDIQKFVDAIDMAREGRIKFEWKPKLVDWPSSKPLFVASNNGKQGYFIIAAEIRVKTDGKSEPSIDVLCGLENFTLDLIAPAASFIKLHFERIRFTVKKGKKAEVDVVLQDIEFVGVLSFVEVLKDLIPLDGFSDPPALTVDERGIDASFSMPLPGITVGVFGLTNLSLGAGFTVPFIGEPLSARFFFCERDKPFTLQVWIFGGGGFFGITIDPGGVQVLEASFEFGASFSIDLGVASGGVQVMAGIYFRMEQDEAQLTGYFRLHGEVDVLGLISASLTLELSLSYEFSSGKCVGRASLTIEVSVLCFSGSVEISCERKFAGSNGDPTFVQMLGPDPTAVDSPWRQYCEAFA